MQPTLVFLRKSAYKCVGELKACLTGAGDKVSSKKRKRPSSESLRVVFFC